MDWLGRRWSRHLWGEDGNGGPGNGMGRRSSQRGSAYLWGKTKVCRGDTSEGDREEAKENWLKKVMATMEEGKNRGGGRGGGAPVNYYEPKAKVAKTIKGLSGKKRGWKIKIGWGTSIYVWLSQTLETLTEGCLIG